MFCEFDSCHKITCTYFYLLVMDIWSRALWVVHVCHVVIQTVLEIVDRRSCHHVNWSNCHKSKIVTRLSQDCHKIVCEFGPWAQIHKRSCDNLVTILDLWQSYDNCRIHKTLVTILGDILWQNLMIRPTS